ncbi:MAG TPA: YggS family pyridoxal phosphate-dependent enzyme [Candidatus Binataceae bacterium]|nr:YggS family pyridoxal phosphate-dependent enzyme [Candidatus Binataceae bacterium]
MLAENEIAKRLQDVRDRIAHAATRARRRPDAIRLVLASKTQPAAAIRAAYEAGARDFGENYIQEAAAKRAELADLRDVTWHLIGHLQSNKTALAVGTFDVIQTLDSVRLADAIGRLRPAPPMRALIEINLGGEANKSGIPASEAQSLIEGARDKTDIIGLMTIPPHTENARRYFAELRTLRDRLAASSGLALSELSMGMTEDFEVAIEEGATMVRVGRAVFGERPA